MRITCVAQKMAITGPCVRIQWVMLCNSVPPRFEAPNHLRLLSPLSHAHSHLFTRTNLSDSLFQLSAPEHTHTLSRSAYQVTILNSSCYSLFVIINSLFPCFKSIFFQLNLFSDSFNSKSFLNCFADYCH